MKIQKKATRRQNNKMEQDTTLDFGVMEFPTMDFPDMNFDGLDTTALETY